MSKKWWTNGSGVIELEIELGDAESCSHQGQCDADVEALSEVPYIKEQLNAIDPLLLVKELREYGAWDDEELVDHDQNLQRVLWIACGDISEEARNEEA